MSAKKKSRPSVLLNKELAETILLALSLLSLWKLELNNLSQFVLNSLNKMVITAKNSMQAYLHQVTYADVEYRKTAPAVNIQKPSIAKSSVCYLTFSDSGACAQTQLEIEQKRLPAAKQWISSLAQHSRSLEILDVWNIQAIHQQVNERIYQISVRVPSMQVQSLLAMSGPGKLQVNVPGALRTNIQHIWLKKEGRPMTDEEVLEVLEDNHGKHPGAFKIRGTWAIRMLTAHHEELKAKLGKNDDPAYFISNVPPEMETENIIELLQLLKWQASVEDGKGLHTRG